MKIINIKYTEESSKAIFFLVTFETKASFFKQSKVMIKRAFLEKWEISRHRYGNNFKWCDNTVNNNKFDDAVVQEMILKYEQRKQ